MSYGSRVVPVPAALVNKEEAMSRNREVIYAIAMVLSLGFVIGQSLYERGNPLVSTGKKAVVIAIASTGRDISSPVSYLFGRAPYYIICDRAKNTYKAVPNKFLDAQHAAGLRSAQMIAGMKVDAVCGNNVGFEPFKVLSQARIEVYTNLDGSVFDALQAFPDGLTKLTAENVPTHFGITGSKKPIACSSFDVTANVARIVQGKFYICAECQYRIAEKNGAALPSNCPKCGGMMREVIAVTAPADTGAVRPKIRVL